MALITQEGCPGASVCKTLGSRRGGRFILALRLLTLKQDCRTATFRFIFHCCGRSYPQPRAAVRYFYIKHIGCRTRFLDGQRF